MSRTELYFTDYPLLYRRVVIMDAPSADRDEAPRNHQSHGRAPLVSHVFIVRGDRHLARYRGVLRIGSWMRAGRLAARVRDLSPVDFGGGSWRAAGRARADCGAFVAHRKKIK
jgi:hypothetical protein